MKSFFPLILIFIFSSFFTACSKDDVQEQEGTVARSIPNLSYGNNTRHKMDIYLPADRSTTKTKTILLIHGGGWTSGAKEEMSGAVDSIRKMLPEYATVNVGYRLAADGTTNVFPAQENDIKAAVEFYLAKSDEYEVSKDLVMVGASAGAHLALLHAYKNDPQRRVKAVADFFGPTDLEAAWSYGGLAHILLWQVTGKTFDQAPELYRNSSPVNFVTAQSPPTIMFQGGVDIVVPPDQTNRLEAKLNAAGVKNQKVFYPAEGHGFTDPNLRDALQKTVAFIRENVR